MGKRILVLLVIVSVMFIVLGIGNVVAQFSVSTTYSDNYPLSLKPGDSEGAFFRVKHVDDTIGKLTIEVVPGESEVAEFLEEDNVFELDFDEEKRVPVRVSISESAEIGTEYEVSALFRTIESEGGEEGGNVQFTISIGKDFPVVVVSEEAEESVSDEEIEEELGGAPGEKIGVSGDKIFGNVIFFLVISIFIVGIVLVYVAIRRRQKSQFVIHRNNFD
jgi:hypothetical protein